MYQVWLERGVNVTWEHLLQALEDVDLMDKAKEVRTKHIQETTNTWKIYNKF